jgi:benzoyl-CoA reductase/2-hydroxyglutaryl-CoA dehydratase subunit BcrC/BadD/HgdB
MDINVLDPERPLETLAKKLLIDWPNPTYTNRIDMVKRIVRDFSIDGIIANNKRGCRNQPAGLRFIKDAAQDVGVPMTIFDLDGLDLREYNDAQAKANIDSFMETIAQQR